MSNMTEIALELYLALLGEVPGIVGQDIDPDDPVVATLDKAEMALAAAGVLDRNRESTGHAQPTCTLDEAVELLNLYVEKDRAGMQALLATVPTTQEVFDDPRLFQTGPPGAPTIGLLGVVSSLFGPVGEGPEEGRSQICAEYDTDGMLVGFRRWAFKRLRATPAQVEACEIGRLTGFKPAFLCPESVFDLGVDPDTFKERLLAGLGVSGEYLDGSSRMSVVALCGECGQQKPVADLLMVDDHLCCSECRENGPVTWDDPEHGVVRAATKKESVLHAADYPQLLVVSTDPGGTRRWAVRVQKPGRMHKACGNTNRKNEEENDDS